MASSLLSYWSRHPIDQDHVLSLFIHHAPLVVVPDPEGCDIVLFPKHLNNPDTAPSGLATCIREDANLAKVLGKKMVIFVICDTEDPFQGLEEFHDVLVLFRTSLCQALRQPYERILPYIWDCGASAMPPFPYTHCFSDLLSATRPSVTISFCGFNSHADRAHTLNILSTMPPHVAKTSYIIRQAFWGGCPHDPNLIQEYEENMQNSHFVVCSRGRGNFSMRLYQTLAAGRIPIFTHSNTMVLPFASTLPWNDVCVVATYAHDIPDALLSFLDTHPDLEEAQRTCRRVYDTYFSPHAFAARLLDQIN